MSAALRRRARLLLRLGLAAGLLAIAALAITRLGPAQPEASGAPPASTAAPSVGQAAPPPAAPPAPVATIRSRPRLVGEPGDGALPAGSPAPAAGRPAPPSRPAAITPVAAVPPVYRQWIAIRDRGFVLRAGARTWIVPWATLRDSLRADADPTGAAHLDFDPAPLAQAIAKIADKVDVAPQDARFRLVGGRAQLVAPAHAGQRVDRDATLAAVRAALAQRAGEAALVVVPRPPAIGDALPGRIALPDRLGQASTSYAGSSAERAHNVEFGTALVDGALVAPGQEFDLNGTLGPLTLAAGFEMGFAIVSDGASVTTVPAEAGGICQVATTLFQSVFWAGLPITERHHHSYWISTYGKAPSGLQGLDATIAPPEKNFRWVNTTGHWMVIRAHASKGTVHFELWGTNPHWQVRVSGPAISAVVPTSYAPIYEKSAAIPRGQTRLVEHAQPGFTADIRRRVFTATGALIDDWHAHGTYLPAHNRYLVGR